MSDGNFKWWMAVGTQDPDFYHGPYDSKEEAIAQAHAEEGKDRGFTIVEADKAKPTSDIFTADSIFEMYEEHNIECWGEDGADFEVTREAEIELEKMLTAALESWFDKFRTRPTPWSFGEQRNKEYFKPSSEAALAIR
jgi:hypothetical protein